MPMPTGERIPFELFTRLIDKVSDLSRTGNEEKKIQCKEFLKSIEIANPTLKTERSSMHKAGKYAKLPAILSILGWSVRDLYADMNIDIPWFNDDIFSDTSGNKKSEELAAACLEMNEAERRVIFNIAKSISPDWWRNIVKKPTQRCHDVVLRYGNRSSLLRALGLPEKLSEGMSLSEVERDTVLALTDRKRYTRIPIESLPTISARLGISLQWLMCLDGEEGMPVYTNDMLTDSILTEYSFMGMVGRHIVEDAAQAIRGGVVL